MVLVRMWKSELNHEIDDINYQMNVCWLLMKWNLCNLGCQSFLQSSHDIAKFIHLCVCEPPWHITGTQKSFYAAYMEPASK